LRAPSATSDIFVIVLKYLQNCLFLAPTLPEKEVFSGPTSVIYFTNQTGLDSMKTQYRVMVNKSFFDNTSNGALRERGVIVMNAEEGTYQLIAINKQS